MNLQMPLSEAGRIYKMYASRLEKLGIYTLGDFLYHIPARYDDFSLISKIANVQAGEIVTIQGVVTEIKNEFTKNWKRIQKALVEDSTGSIEVVWFNQPYLLRVIRTGDRISLSGRANIFIHKLIIESPEYEILPQNSEETTTIHTGRLVPIYPETKGVSSKWLRRQIFSLLKSSKQNMAEYIPDSIIKTDNLVSIQQAFEQIHFPTSFEHAQQAKKRLAFDELFLLQLQAAKRRTEWDKTLVGNSFKIDTFQKQIENFWQQLPFELTQAQRKAVRDIFKDLSAKKPMNRLLEGDVGSGKTVVGTIAMYVAHLNGYQSVLMAPTEILAQQHFKTIEHLLSPFGVNVDLVTGSSKFQMSNFKSQMNNPEQSRRINTNSKKPKPTKDSKLEIGNWKFDILIGTHAVLSDKINFENLGLVIIDEQQRFGVEQRSIIRKKGKSAHVLTMTATPIPRTVALTLYGDLDLSYLDEMPKGRKIIKTWLVPEEKRLSGYEWIKKQIQETNSQAFIICPFIEESESMQTVKAASREFERLQKDIYPDLKLGLIHGKLKAKEKDKILGQFRNKEFDILVATPVVEVGIDIPNATIMVIEASERFGLAQLHQLRGRVGRGDKQSYCLLFTESKNHQTIERLKTMEHTYIGAELAEYDLKLRGPGDMYGTMQHGMKQLKVASFSDFVLIQKARHDAEQIFPKLSEYPLLEKKLQEITQKAVSPD